MTERDAFLQAIIENPDDDTPRLIYADRLEEWGEHDRAEFIRLQVAIAKSGHKVGVSLRQMTSDDAGIRAVKEEDPALERLLRREQFLLGKWGIHWLREVKEFGIEFAGVSSLMQAFRRGFVAHVTLSAAEWLTNADALTAATPIEEVTLAAGLDWWCPDSKGTVALEPDDVSRGRVRYDCKRVKYGQWFGNNPGGGTVLDYVLKHEWPRVKKWNLPDE